MRLVPTRAAALLATTLLAGAAQLATAGPAAAGEQSQRAVGTGVLTSPPTVLSEIDAGPNRVLERTATGLLGVSIGGSAAGPFVGTFVQHVHGVVRSDGTVVFQGTLDFSGTAASCGTGAFTMTFAGRGTAGAHPVTDAVLTVSRPTRDSVPIVGHGTVHQDGPVLTYDVTFRCR